MNRGCLVLAGLGLLSLLVFGVTLEAIDDPKELTAIPFSPWDFVTYGLTALGIVAIVRLVRRPNRCKAIARTWTSRLTRQGSRVRSSLRLAPDGSAQINTTVSQGIDSRTFSTDARWQLLDNKTFHLWGSQTVTWKILRLNSWSMITADQAGAGCPVRWTALPKFNLWPWLLIATAVVLPVLIALSLPRSRQSHAIADDPQYVLPSSLPQAYRSRH
jgi:hypothetical protein